VEISTGSGSRPALRCITRFMCYLHISDRETKQFVEPLSACAAAGNAPCQSMHELPTIVE